MTHLLTGQSLVGMEWTFSPIGPNCQALYEAKVLETRGIKSKSCLQEDAGTLGP